MSHTTLIAYLVHPKGPGVERSMLFPLIIEVPFTESGKKRPCDFKYKIVYALHGRMAKSHLSDSDEQKKIPILLLENRTLNWAFC